MADEKNVGAAAADAANPQEAVVRVEGLQKSFGSNVVLRGIDLTVMPGQVVTIIGASGSGKSTLLRCINLLETPDAGHVWFHGKDLAAEHVDINALREKIGMVFQSFNLFNNMNVLDNCTLAPVTLKKMTKEQAEKVALANLDSVGLADFAGADVNTLSGGQKQRVAIARALCMKPDLMLFDEPTSALDPEDLRRGPRGHASPGIAGHDHGRGDARDGVRAQCLRRGCVHGQGRDCREGQPREDFHQSREAPHARVPRAVPVGSRPRCPAFSVRFRNLPSGVNRRRRADFCSNNVQSRCSGVILAPEGTLSQQSHTKGALGSHILAEGALSPSRPARSVVLASLVTVPSFRAMRYP